MTRAIWHFLLLMMIYQDVVHPITLSCLPNDSCSCRNTVQTIKWEIFCSLPEKIDLTVSLDQYDKTATVHCHDMNTWPLVEIGIFKLTGPRIAVRFDQCPLAKWPLNNMIKNAGNETLNALKLGGLTSTMSKLTRRNFSGLPTIDELWLDFNGVVEFSADALQDLSDLRVIRFWKNEISVLPQGIFEGLTKLETLWLIDNKMQVVNSLLFENLTELKSLSLSDNHLKSLEPGTFRDLANLMNLNIANNYLTTLSKDIFEPLEKLTKLQMSGNEFFSLPHGLLIGNSGLVTVEFDENRGNLSILPDGFLSNLTFLRDAHMSGNNFTDLPEDIFLGSPRVDVVHLSRNKLSKISEKTFKNLTSVYLIDLSHNELNNLPDGFLKGLEQLTYLDLQSNAITSISRNLFSNSIDLQSIHFDFNQTSKIESWIFSNLTRLLSVKLNKNELANLPENIFWGSSNLQYLDISENRLTDLPVKLFRDSASLIDLNLNANKLKNLPEGIFQGLDKLTNLNLENNGFTTLPDTVLSQTTSLRDLRLGFNCMTEINIGRLRRIRSLEVASFSHNLITHIIPPTFSEGPEPFSSSNTLRLTNLMLDHNNITHFPWYEMYMFEKLSLLNLTGNRISSVGVFSLQTTNEAVTIDVTSNNITKLDISNIPSDSRVLLYIGDNPIDCGCDVYQLRKDFVDRTRRGFNKKYIIMANDLTCSRPKSMVGKPIQDLELETFECELNDIDKPRICLEECDCMWRPFDDTLVVNCSYRNLTRMPYEFYGFEGIAIELNLTGNSITEMSFFHKNSWTKYKYEKVRKVFLSYNRIRTVTFDVVPANLSVLHLDNNNLTRFHVAVAETVRSTTSLQSLRLHSNPWSCDVETREAFNILKEKLDRRIGDAFGKSCLDPRIDKNGDEEPTSYITYQMF